MNPDNLSRCKVQVSFKLIEMRKLPILRLCARLLYIGGILCIISCEKLLEVDPPRSLAEVDKVFSDDINATAAAKGMYAFMLGQENFASGYYKSIVTLGGLCSDELIRYYPSVDYFGFEANELLPNDLIVLSIWQSMYKSIYDANLIIKGLKESTSVTQSTREQLMGEALFVRAFCHFYLVNLFGRIPVVTTTDYRINESVHRSDVDVVYNQIVRDLEEARALLPIEYEGEGRVRPNKGTVRAMLARVYLFMSEWSKAEVYASEVIDDAQRYSLPEDLNSVFLTSSTEAIWQLSLPSNFTASTWEGRYFNITSASDLQNNVLRDEFLTTFEANDKRLENWIKPFDTGNGLVYYPNKYKVKFKPATTLPTEYSMVLRLAEQYLIRAEARAKQNKLASAITDIDVIRDRAGLSRFAITNPSISKEDLLTAIEHERRVELFVEWGHRWFDLKRTNRADAVLGALKPTWQSTDDLFPFPQIELDKNPNLRPQNPGY